MDISYGVGTRNRYELFYDNDNDVMDMLKKPKKKAKNAEKENKSQTPKPKEATTNTVTEIKTAVKVSPTEPAKVEKKQNGEPKKFGDREERNNRQNRTENHVEKGEPKPNGLLRSDDKMRGGRGRGRGGFGRGEFRGKRDFDRRSGMPNSGVKPQDKRRGGGSHNWGSDKDQIETAIKTEEKAPSEENEEQAPEVKENEEPKEMTLDEWKALHKREKPQFNVRKAGEGEDNEQWKNCSVLEKKKAAAPASDQSTDPAEPVQQPKKKDVSVPIEFRFSDSRGNRRRGGGRGGKYSGRGGHRGEKEQKAPQMDNELDFPSLG